MSPSTSSPSGGLFLLQAKPAKTTSKPVDTGDFQCGWGKKSQKGVILQYKKSQKGVYFACKKSQKGVILQYKKSQKGV